MTKEWKAAIRQKKKVAKKFASGRTLSVPQLAACNVKSRWHVNKVVIIIIVLPVVFAETPFQNEIKGTQNSNDVKFSKSDQITKQKHSK